MVRFFVERHLLVNVIVLFTLAFGAFVATKTQRESFPATTLNIIRVTAVVPGAGARQVEQQVVIPMERAIGRVENISSTQSVSLAGIGAIVIELDPSVNDAEVRLAQQEIEREVAEVRLPSTMPSRPRVTRLDPALIPALEVFLAGEDDQAVRRYAAQLERRLERLDGVNEVRPIGIGDPELTVEVEPKDLVALGLSFDEIIAAIRSAQRTETAGRLESFPQEKEVVIERSLKTRGDVENIILRASPLGGDLKVADVAQVKEGVEDVGIKVHGDGQSGVSLVVRKQKASDIIKVVDTLREALAKETPPAGITMRLYNDSSRMARDRLNLVATNGATGIVLVIVVLMFFLNRRIAMWVAFGIPFSVFGVLMLLPLVDITVNMVSMAAFVLVVGLIVDDAIVVAERIAFWREAGVAPKEAATKGAVEMALPVFASCLTTICAFSPMFALGGLPGRFSWAIPTVVILALGVSLFECFFLLPAHLSGDGGKEILQPRPWMERLRGAYQRQLERLLKRRVLVVSGFLVLFAATMAYAALAMPIVLFPQDDARVLFVRLRMPPGTPLLRTEAAVFALERQLTERMESDLDGLSTRVGHQVESMAKDRGDAQEEAIIRVYLADEREHSPLWWADRLRDEIPAPKGASLVFEHQVIGPPLGKPITLHLIADDDDLRRTTAEIARAWMEAHPALVDVEVDSRAGPQQVDLRPNPRRMSEAQVDPDVVARAIRVAFFGVTVAETVTAESSTAIRLRASAPSRRSLDAALNLRVRSRTGALVPLQDLLDPVDVNTVSRVVHLDGSRATTLTASLARTSEATATGVATEMEQQLYPQLEDPQLELRLGGEAKGSRETLGEMPFVGGAALLGMVLIVTLLFGSFLQALLVIAAVPLGYVGVVWAFAAHDMPLSFFAFLGAIGLSGVVVNDSIVMVTTLLRAARARGEEEQPPDETRGVVERDLSEAEVAASAAERLRPVLLTSVTTIVGVMPTAYGVGGRDVLLSPMSVALGWGLLFATGVTLLLVPALYLLRQDVERQWRRLWGR